MSDTQRVGVHGDIPEAVYHADRASLSYSGAKLLLSSPAKFRQAQDHPPKPKREYDLGHLAHKLILGKGADLVVVDAPDWRTKDAREARDQAHELGLVPVLESQLANAEQMRAAVLEHELAGPLFAEGRAEVSMYAGDPDTAVRLRGRADWLTNGNVINIGDRLLIVDYKTTTDANPKSWWRASLRFGYHMQFAWYVTLARALRLDDSPIFLHVCQELDPPHLISVNEFGLDEYKLGLEQMREAIDIYVECQQTGTWPGYPPLIHPISYAPWAFRRDFNEPVDID